MLDRPFVVDLLLRFWLPDDRVFEEAERALLFDDAGVVPDDVPSFSTEPRFRASAAACE